MADHNCCWCGRDAPVYITHHHYYPAAPAIASPQPALETTRWRPTRHGRTATSRSIDITSGLVDALQNLGMYVDNSVVQSVVGGGGRGFSQDTTGWYPAPADSVRDTLGDQFADMIMANPNIRVFMEPVPRSSWSADRGQPPHLTTSQLMRLRHYTHEGGESDGGGVPCGVCQSGFQNDEVLVELPCKHSFHTACISPWLLTQSNTCPLCRAEVYVEDSQDGGGDDDEEPEPPLSP